MQRSGSADLPLHYGRVPPWLAERMSKLGGAIVENIVQEYGRDAFLERISHPGWFQSLGCVLGMDWHSSGITTAVMGALKKALNPRSRELGIYICGGRGKHSRQTPAELSGIAEQTGLDGNYLAHCSRLAAKVDNAAVQDGFQLYLHSFILVREGRWAVVQQGMNEASRLARRYHWHSSQLRSFVEDPHTAVIGRNMGPILNLTCPEAAGTRDAMLRLSCSLDPSDFLRQMQHITMPAHHAVYAQDVNQKRLGAVLALAHDLQPARFQDLLLLKGVGPRTLQSLALVSEVIHGTPSRFDDPARFSFAHGGKDGHPFPVPLRTYDETIRELKAAVESARIDHTEKRQAISQLHKMSLEVEQHFVHNNRFGEWLEKEKNTSHLYGGRTVHGPAKKPKTAIQAIQLSLF